ncbi:ribosome recycling factor [Anaerosolibacter sp.]|jgi:ribosome recycling factor|uniref:ribosome recycling factor n=1 Tax=Anaerosolibacter sp. TaxID=1872527 RepID=UPI0026255EE8|nr:ribosome recycling factor [Anaerosolibacter sp.]MDF2545873.1 ribosome recycling factor [Anaerosolibacter sp.]
MSLSVHKELDEKMQKTIRVLKEELHSIRAGRANPALLDRIVVEYYGSPTPLKQIATVSAPEPRLLIIQPFDKSSVQSIEKAITQSDLGINPSNDGKIIRLAIPQLTEERRKELTKLAKKVGEDAKVAIRNERRDANDKLKKMQKNAEITEDDLKKSEDEVQKMTNKHIEIIDELIEKKEKEIMEV